MLSGFLVARTRLSGTPGNQEAKRYLFGCEGEYLVVTPLAVDVQKQRPYALGSKPQLLYNAKTRCVLGANCDFHPVQTARKAVIGGHGDCSRNHAPPGKSLVHPITDARATQRTPRDPSDSELAAQNTVVGERKRPRPARACLRAHARHHRGKPRDVFSWPRQGMRKRRVPGPQPLSVADPQHTPDGAVTAPQRPEPNQGLGELNRPRTLTHESRRSSTSVATASPARAPPGPTNAYAMASANPRSPLATTGSTW